MSMNIFRLAGDMSHVFSIIILLLRLRVVKNAHGKNEGELSLELAVCLIGLSFFSFQVSLFVDRPKNAKITRKGHQR